VDVDNNPYSLANFDDPERIIDFDFTDLTVEQAGSKCPVSVRFWIIY